MSAKVDDKVAVRLAAMDYAEGWFDGDVERVTRCLHPKLVKRTMERSRDTGEISFRHLTREDLIRSTQDGGGMGVPRDRLYYKVDILDMYEEIALVRVETYPYLDYLQLVKEAEQWSIVNVLYTAKRAKKEE